MSRELPKASRPAPVTVAYVHNGEEVAHSFADMLNQLLFFDAANKGRILGGGYIKMRCGTNGLVEARNKVVQTFLETESEWLFWIDTDMGFQPDALERFMRTADPVTHPIVGGLCFANKETHLDGYGGYLTAARVTIMDWLPETEDRPATFAGRAWYRPDEVTSCAGTGSAFLVIHRSVFEKIQAEYGNTWYDQIRGNDGTPIGEDISFCARATALGFPVHVDAGVKTTHMKTVWLGEQDFWDQQLAPPATERVMVLSPKGWEDNESFKESLFASTGLASITDLAVWEKAPERPWLFLASPDTLFGPGWYDHALRAARAGGADVVGTGGGLLVKRSYIEEQGASWDGPGILKPEGYGSTGWLNEIIAVAKQRDTFTVALASRVTMTSPPEIDKHDNRLFEARSRKYGKAAA